jgi:hypothetical protein
VSDSRKEAAMQTWATFSIYDHRTPVYRPSLALFDGIVVPIPKKPVGKQTQEELERLVVDVGFLARNGIAKPFAWDSDAFQEWRRPFLAEAAAAGINREAVMDTRLMIAEKTASRDVIAVPVYGTPEQFAARSHLQSAEQALTNAIVQRIPVPDDDTPLDDILWLRDSGAFKAALSNLLEWKQVQALVIAQSRDRKAALAAALEQFDRYTLDYAKAMEEAGFKKIIKVASIFFSPLLGDFVGAIKEGLVSYSEIREPCWKVVADRKCSPGGVVYHFREAVH